MEPGPSLRPVSDAFWSLLRTQSPVRRPRVGAVVALGAPLSRSGRPSCPDAASRPSPPPSSAAGSTASRRPPKGLLRRCSSGKLAKVGRSSASEPGRAGAGRGGVGEAGGGGGAGCQAPTPLDAVGEILRTSARGGGGGGARGHSPPHALLHGPSTPLASHATTRPRHQPAVWHTKVLPPSLPTPMGLAVVVAAPVLRETSLFPTQSGRGRSPFDLSAPRPTVRAPTSSAPHFPK